MNACNSRALVNHSHEFICECYIDEWWKGRPINNNFSEYSMSDRAELVITAYLKTEGGCPPADWDSTEDMEKRMEHCMRMLDAHKELETAYFAICKLIGRIGTDVERKLLKIERSVSPNNQDEARPIMKCTIRMIGVLPEQMDMLDVKTRGYVEFLILCMDHG